jgi:hypothetical protein
MILIHCFKLWRSLCIILLIVDKKKIWKQKISLLIFLTHFSVHLSQFLVFRGLTDWVIMARWKAYGPRIWITIKKNLRGLKSLTLYRLHELVWVGVRVCVCENMFLRVFIFITCFYYETVRVCVWKHVFVFLVFVYLKISEICIRNLCTLLSIVSKTIIFLYF